MGSIETIKPLLSTALRSSTVNKLWERQESNPVRVGVKRKRSLCIMPSPILFTSIHSMSSVSNRLLRFRWCTTVTPAERWTLRSSWARPTTNVWSTWWTTRSTAGPEAHYRSSSVSPARVVPGTVASDSERWSEVLLLSNPSAHFYVFLFSLETCWRTVVYFSVLQGQL